MAKKFNFKELPVKVGGITAGVAGGKLIKKMMPNANPLIPAGLALVGGAVIPSFVKGELFESVGNGLMAQGASQLLDKFVPAINGVGEVGDVADEPTNENISNEYLMAGLGLADDINDGLGNIAEESANDGLGNVDENANDGLGSLGSLTDDEQ